MSGDQITVDGTITGPHLTGPAGATGSAGAAGAAGATGATGPAGPIAGTDKQVAFNDGGSAAGDSAFTFDKATGTVSATKFAGTVVAPDASGTTAPNIVGASNLTSGFGVTATGTVFAAQGGSVKFAIFSSGPTYFYTPLKLNGSTGVDITSPNSTTFQVGLDSATPASVTIRGPGSRSGTDTNTASGAVTVGPGPGTGSATGAALYLSMPYAGSTGTGAQSSQTFGFTATSSTVTGALAAPTQVSATVAGNSLALSASNATAGSSSSGAAAGGSVTITAGNAAQKTSGNANGGGVTIVTGTKVGTGLPGYFGIKQGGSGANPILIVGDDYTHYEGVGVVASTASYSANAVLGPYAGGSAPTGSYNTIMGYTANQGLTSGGRNSSFGYQAGGGGGGVETSGYQPINNLTGGDNTMIGAGAAATASSTAPAHRIGIGSYARAWANYSAVIGGKLVTLVQVGSDSGDTTTKRALRAAGARGADYLTAADTNTGASPIALQGGLSNGNVAGGDVLIETALPGASGTTQNSPSTRYQAFAAPKALTLQSATNFVRVNFPASSGASVAIAYNVTVTDAAGEFKVHGGRYYVSCYRKSTGNAACSTVVETGETNAASTGNNITDTITATGDATGVVFAQNANEGTGLSTPTGKMVFSVEVHSTGTASIAAQ